MFLLWNCAVAMSTYELQLPTRALSLPHRPFISTSHHNPLYTCVLCWARPKLAELALQASIGLRKFFKFFSFFGSFLALPARKSLSLTAPMDALPSQCRLTLRQKKPPFFWARNPKIRSIFHSKWPNFDSEKNFFPDFFSKFSVFLAHFWRFPPENR